MKIQIFIPYHNQAKISHQTALMAKENAVLASTHVCTIRNGGEEMEDIDGVSVLSVERNMGNYPVFFWSQGFLEPDTDIVGFIHSDLFIHEKGWDYRLEQAFSVNEKIGLIGVIGSNEIESNGGRGLGTTSNFQGLTVGEWTGSHSSVHGKTDRGLSRAVVVDGCGMFFRRSVLESIPFRHEFPIHHFYDRLLSCEVIERGYEVAVLGLAVDHISGQTANTQESYFKDAERWLRYRGVWRDGKPADQQLYEEAERQFLEEYRDAKHFIPRKV